MCLITSVLYEVMFRTPRSEIEISLVASLSLQQWHFSEQPLHHRFRNQQRKYGGSEELAITKVDPLAPECLELSRVTAFQPLLRQRADFSLFLTNFHAQRPNAGCQSAIKVHSKEIRKFFRK